MLHQKKHILVVRSIVFNLIIVLMLFATADAQNIPDTNNSQTIFREGDTINLSQIVKDVANYLEEQLNRTDKQNIVNDTSVLRMLFDTKYGELNQNEAYAKLYQEQITALNNDWGLKIKGNYTENFEPGFFEDEDISFLRRLYVGLEWDLLSNGLISNSNKIEALKKDLRIKTLEQNKLQKQSNYIYLYNYIVYIFKRFKTEKLNERLDLIQDQLTLARKLYHLRYISWERILELERKYKQVSIMRNNNTVYYNSELQKAFEDIFVNSNIIINHLPLFSINPDKMIEQFNNRQIDEELANLRVEKFEAERKGNTDIAIRPYLRWYYLMKDAYTSQNYGSAGISVSIPLRFKSTATGQAEAQKQIILNDQSLDQFNDANEILNYYYEFEFKKSQYATLYFQKLVTQERLRKELIKRDLGDEGFSPVRAISILDEVFSSDIEMMDLKRDMYLRLLKIYTLLETHNPNNFTNVVYPQSFVSKFDGNRSIYLWSEEFTKVGNKSLVAYLKNNELDHVLLSPGANFDAEKLKSFISLCHFENITVDAMIGSNRMIMDPGFESLRQKTILLGRFDFDGLHLDVEPHALSDWQANRTTYLEQYVKMLREAKSLCGLNDWKLSVSIPVFYPPNTLKSIYQLTDQVYLMAYGHASTDYIQRKTAEEIAIDNTKTTIALSASDFKDRLEMETFIKKLIEVIGVDRIAIHDFERLIQLDDESINTVESNLFDN